MRPVSPVWSTIVAYSHPMIAQVESWLGEQQLAADVPFTTGSIDCDDTGTVKRRLTLTVPVRTPERSWDPVDDPYAPLAVYGQRLHVWAGIGYPDGSTEILNQGWYVITKWSFTESDSTISVEAQDLAQLLVDDRFTQPHSPLVPSSYGQEFTRLIDGIMPVRIDLPDRDMPDAATTVWDRDRDQALNELTAAWPARWYIDDDGTAVAAPPYDAVSDDSPLDVQLTDGSLGTITARQRGSDRGALYNIAVVDGKTNDDGSPGPHAVAQVTSPASPIRVDGPYGRIPQFYSSDLIVTRDQAQATADTNLISYATAGRTEPVTIVPDPALELGDVCRVYTKDGFMCTGRIQKLTLPLTPGDAPMDVTVACLPAGVTTQDTTITHGEV